MADETLSADLELDIGGALSNVDQLGQQVESALGAGVASFSDQMAAAVASVPDVEITPDVGEVEPAITSAVDAADTVAEVTADATAITPEVEGAISSVDGTVPVEATGTETITGDIEGAVAAADTTATVDADTSEAVSMVDALSAFIDAQAPTIEVDADTAEAQSAVEELSASTATLGGEASGAAGGTHQLEGAAAALGGSAAIATGEVGGLKEVAHGVGVGGTAGALGVTALAGATAELFHEGVQAVGATQRFETVLGEMAGTVEHVHVGDLSRSLGELGIQFGSTEAEMQNATASVFQFGVNGGKSREESAQFASTLAALAARAISLNPNLGTLADVTESMATKLARGGRFAANFQLALTPLEITTRALADTGKENAAELTLQEKSFAGAQIAAERYGTGLSTTVTTGAQNAQNVQKALTATIKEAIETVAAPLVIPMFDLIKAGTPVIEALGHILSTVATSALPAITAATSAAAIPLQALAEVVDLLAPAIGPAVVAFAAFEAATLVLPAIATVVATGLFAMGTAAEGAAVMVDEASAAMTATPFGLIVAGVAVAATALGVFGSSEESVTDMTKKMVAEMEKADAKKLIHDFEGSVTIRAFADDVSTGTASLRQFKVIAGENLGVAQRLYDALKAAGEPTVGFKKALDEAATSAKNSARAQEETDAATKKLTEDTAALATSTLPELKQGFAETAAESQSSVVAMTDGVAALARYEGGALALAQTTSLLDAAQKALPAAVLEGNNAYVLATATALANKAALDETAAALIRASTPLAGITEGTRAYSAELAAQQTANLNAESALGRYASGTLSASEATAALDAAAKGLNATLDITLGRFVSQQQAHVAFDTSLAAVNTALTENGVAVDFGSAAAEKNVTAVNQAAGAATAWSSAIAANGGTVAEQQVPLQMYGVSLQTLRDNLAAAGADTSFVDGLIAHNNAALGEIQASVPLFNAAGVQVGTGVTTGAADGSASLSNVVLNNSNAAHEAVSNSAPVFDAAGNRVGSAVASGAGEGASGTSPAVAGEVDRAAGAAALAGANMHNIGYGIGASFSSGIGDGIIANDGYVQAQARQVVVDAETAARTAAESHSPSRLFARLGTDLSAGLAVGMDAGIPLVTEAAKAQLDAAVMQAGWDALNAYLRTAAAGTEPGGDFYNGPALDPKDYHDGHYDDPRLAGASTPFTPSAVVASAPGPPIEFNIEVHGVDDPATGRAVGEQIAEGATAALGRRGFVVTARMG